jgi:endonuclease-3
MSTSNRTAVLNKANRVLKKSYKVVPLRGEQPLLESLLFACCLENARYDVAREAFEKVRGAFFDWNEIRVSTVKELAETLTALPDPAAAASRLKSILQAVFESDYSFDLEHLKKLNLGAAVKKLQKLPGATPFGVAYATQVSLRGHAIPIDRGTLGALYVLGAISAAEAENHSVPGIERVVSKSKGHEFGALLHELGADFHANPFAPALRELMLSIARDAKERFPKRTAKKPAAEPEPAPQPPPANVAAATDKKKAASAEAAKKPAAKVPSKPAPRPAKAPAARAKKQPTARTKKPTAKSLAKRKPR